LDQINHDCDYKTHILRRFDGLLQRALGNLSRLAQESIASGLRQAMVKIAIDQNTFPSLNKLVRTGFERCTESGFDPPGLSRMSSLRND
jgi:hypothetical protein